MILFKFPSGPLETNAVLFACPKTASAAVIDPSQGSAELVMEKAQELQVTIQKILLTHTHWDHIADVHSLVHRSGAEVYVHPLDASNLEHPGCDGVPLFFPIHGVRPDRFVHEGESLFVGEIRCEVIHTPGHTPGGVCYFLPDQKLLFSGDTLFQGSIGNLNLPTSEPNRMWGSLEKLAKLPADIRVVPGHGADTTIGEERWLSRAREIFE